MQVCAKRFMCGLFGLIVTACLSMAPVGVSAALMDNEDDLIARYGDDYRESHPDHAHLVAPADKTMLWEDLPDYEAYAHVFRGRSQCEVFTLKREITTRDDRVVQKILADNAGGEQWVPMPDEMMPGYNTLQSAKGQPEYKYLWKQKKSSRIAAVSKDQPSKLEISTEAWRDAKARASR